MLIGGAGNDLFLHDAGNDSIDGGADIDTVNYNDLTTAAVTVNLATGTAVTGVETDTLANIDNVLSGGGADLLTGSAGANTLDAGAGNDIVDGGAGNDILLGRSGNDTLQGGAGDDLLAPGTGNDVVDGGAGNNTVTYLDLVGAGALSVDLSAHTATVGASEIDTLLNIQNVIGSAAADSLTGDAQANVLDGGDGDDMLNGGRGDDIIEGGLGNNTVTYADLVSADPLSVDLTAHTATVGISEIDTLFNIRNVVGSAGTDSISGDAQDNRLEGGDSDDLLNGGAGVDTLIGGSGNDIYFVDDAADAIVEAAGEGNDRVLATAASYTLGANLEELAFVGVGDFTGTGNAGANLITGGDGVNTLYGMAGDDTLDAGNGGASVTDILVGGTGNDVYILDNPSDELTLPTLVRVVENANEGIDTVRTTRVAHVLESGVENLVFTSDGFHVGVGNELDNQLVGGTGDDELSGMVGNDVLIGGTGNDILTGGDGADVMAGGSGNDTYDVSDAGDTVNENLDEGQDTVATSLGNYTLGANVEALKYNGSYAGTGVFVGQGNALANVIEGSNGIDSLLGNGGNDSLYGGAGNDILNGGADSDNLYGGDGSDTLIGGTEDDNLFGGAGNDTLEGNNGNDALQGNDGNDILNGSAGDDQMAGGAGNDVYYVDSALDQALENAGEGVDEVLAVGNADLSYTLSANVDNLSYAGTGQFTGVGNDIDNLIAGGSGSDTLDGAGGNDTLIGGTGDDTLLGGAGDDTLSGGTGSNVLNGGSGFDTVSYADYGRGVSVLLSTLR